MIASVDLPLLYIVDVVFGPFFFSYVDKVTQFWENHDSGSVCCRPGFFLALGLQKNCYDCLSEVVVL